ncbi:MAG: hypothetical protein HQL74_02380 [Magnetococcales bacterium]|nr:hypothetical protein [Magnetococcales bacterium]
MRTSAEADGIEVHGILWIMDHMISKKIVPPDRILEALKKMLADTRCHVPDLELTQRIHKLSTHRFSP